VTVIVEKGAFQPGMETRGQWAPPTRCICGELRAAGGSATKSVSHCASSARTDCIQSEHGSAGIFLMNHVVGGAICIEITEDAKS
jgi:hypothetical protein